MYYADYTANFVLIDLDCRMIINVDFSMGDDKNNKI